MENLDLFKQLLEGQEKLSNEMKRFSIGQEKLAKEVDRLSVGQEKLAKEVDRLSIGQEKLTKEVDRLSIGQEQLFKGQDQLFGEVRQINQRIGALESEVAEMKRDMGTKAQQAEHTDLIWAILHQQEMTRAEPEALKLNSITKEALEYFVTKEELIEFLERLSAARRQVELEVLRPAK